MISADEFSKKQVIYLYALKGERVSFKNDNIIISTKDGEVKHQSSCYRLFIIFVLGNFTLTSVLMENSKNFGFYICVMKSSTRVIQILGNNLDGNTHLKKRQYGYNDLIIGKAIVLNKISNQKRALEKIRNRGEKCEMAIAKLNEHIFTLKGSEDNLQSIMGIEGSSARIYFSALYDGVGWKSRKPRIKSDYINATLDIGYTILFNYIECILKIFGFDLYQGVLHKTFYMRKSLVCDIVEPFRPIIDYQIRKSFNLGQFKESDFRVENRRYKLDFKKSQEYTEIILEELLQNDEKIFKYIRDYYRYFMKKKSVGKMPEFHYGGEK